MMTVSLRLLFSAYRARLLRFSRSSAPNSQPLPDAPPLCASAVYAQDRDDPASPLLRFSRSSAVYSLLTPPPLFTPPPLLTFPDAPPLCASAVYAQDRDDPASPLLRFSRSSAVYSSTTLLLRSKLTAASAPSLVLLFSAYKVQRLLSAPLSSSAVCSSEELNSTLANNPLCTHRTATTLLLRSSASHGPPLCTHRRPCFSAVSRFCSFAGSASPLLSHPPLSANNSTSLVTFC